MKLNAVEIKNFRSVEHQTIEFDPTCRILVGINKSGKTTILHALALLDPQRVFSKDDIRIASPDEAESTEAYIRFVFRLETTEIRSAEEIFRSKMLLPEGEFFLFKQIRSGASTTIHEFCSNQNASLYHVDLVDERNARRYSYYSITGAYALLGKLFRPSALCPTDYVLPGQSSRLMKEIDLIETSMVDASIPKEYLEVANLQYVAGLWGNLLIAALKDKHPSVLLWEYDPSFILPPRINTAEFIANPSVPVPLRNMFELASYTDIPQAFSNARAKTQSKAVSNMLSRVAKHATEHFKEVWQEYSSLEFSLTENGEYIEISIKDVRSTDFNFAQRSDGFKRFVTFLLLVSTRFKLNKLENTLLLIDEPDIALHPSGSKYLRKELLKIAQGNYLVYSTHSIFMIDPARIDRHLIVKKVKEITFVSAVTPSTVRDEEVIFNALGTSIYETLKECNILFEGWFDKTMFRVALTRMPPEYKDVGDKLRKIGYAHSTGVKTIQYVTPTIEMANKKLLILSDCDPQALQYQKLYADSQGYGTWLRYDEVLAGTKALTGEDFLKVVAFKAALKSLCVQHPNLTMEPDSALEEAENKLKHIQAWLTKAGLTGDEVKTAIKKVKEDVFATLKNTYFTDQYYEFLAKLAEKIDSI